MNNPKYILGNGNPKQESWYDNPRNVSYFAEFLIKVDIIKDREDLIKYIYNPKEYNDLWEKYKDYIYDSEYYKHEHEKEVETLNTKYTLENPKYILNNPKHILQIPVIEGTKHILGFPVLRKIRPEELEQIPWGVKKIRADDVWNEYKVKGKEINIGIIDTGLDHNHPDLKDNIKGGYNFVDNDDNISDDNGHGSHVAGIIAALANKTGIIGVAPEANLYGVKAINSEGVGNDSDIIAAIEWCINNKMNIINMSFGDKSTTKAETEILNKAYDKGILLIAAAGNSGSGRDTIDYPAKHERVIAIGAVDEKDKRASFSSTGPSLEVSAPGVDILSTTPGTYDAYSGTSMACPHVVGLAALIMGYNPSLIGNNEKIREIIDNSTVHLGKIGKNIQYGFGRIDAKLSIDNIRIDSIRIDSIRYVS